MHGHKHVTFFSVTCDYSGFIYLVSLSDATEDSTELLYFLSSFLFGVVDDGWQSLTLGPASQLIAGVAGTTTNNESVDRNCSLMSCFKGGISLEDVPSGNFLM